MAVTPGMRASVYLNLNLNPSHHANRNAHTLSQAALASD